MKLRARKNIPNTMIYGHQGGSRGRTERGQEFEADGIRARRLISSGYAERVDDDRATPSETKIDATDSARELAAEKGVDLSSVTGTGSGGRITKADIERA